MTINELLKMKKDIEQNEATKASELREVLTAAYEMVSSRKATLTENTQQRNQVLLAYEAWLTARHDYELFMIQEVDIKD